MEPADSVPDRPGGLGTRTEEGLPDRPGFRGVEERPDDGVVMTIPLAGRLEISAPGFASGA
jgi:hypothetical protein